MYHYGVTIREYREKKGWTIRYVADNWPTHAVTANYVSDIERGVKHISDMQVLRALAMLLDIPLWEFGLSDYNPFQKASETEKFFDADTLHELIEDLWLVRQNISFDMFEIKVNKLSRIFKEQSKNNPLIKDSRNYLRLFAHFRRLQEVIYTERHEYSRAKQYATDMLRLATLAGDKVAIAISYTRIGVELLRDDDRTALEPLRKACDISLSLPSKDVRSYCYAMLARAYAQFGDLNLFERNIDVAANCGTNMEGQAVSTKDFVYHAYSATLEEKSNGYILFGDGVKALQSLIDIEYEIKKERNSYLGIWLPLDYAQSHMLQGQVEESLRYLEIFYNNAVEYKSERIIRRIQDHMEELDDKGYGEVMVVRNFKEMLAGR